MVLRTFPRAPGGIDYDAPAGDLGWFGPESVTWRIHGDFAGMLSGGLCALMLQTLHPRALAGIWDHSNFRTDLLGRLRRTTQFVAATSYAPSADAESLSARVRKIHAQVKGVDQFGQSYSADDPALLTWVHVTEVLGFLTGYRKFGGLPLTSAIEDQYFNEVAIIAERLGADSVPRSRAQIETYLQAQQTQLRFTERSEQVLNVLSAMRLPAGAMARDVFLHAGASLLPPWAQTLLQQSTKHRVQAKMASAIVKTLSPSFRAALNDGVAARAMRRVDRDSKELARWPSTSPQLPWKLPVV